MTKKLLFLALASEHLYRKPLLEGFTQYFCGPDATINNGSQSVLN